MSERTTVLEILRDGLAAGDYVRVVKFLAEEDMRANRAERIRESFRAALTQINFINNNKPPPEFDAAIDQIIEPLRAHGVS